MTIFESFVAILEFLNFIPVSKTKSQPHANPISLNKKEKLLNATFLVVLLGGLFLYNLYNS